ncbi:DUF6443 domain-containing protein [Dyadobacter pollutisoli]|uniref:DUF6443 domain-containing protein n=2 Tax=Dyadobacter pollutisoli TaxID=2910158 RepID=A0A9E8SJ05_9BACT|nr:DUF6443 domain-containing protein [Dyadobacter pollutisoli]WAC10368.1 DUF6443 domain-containing protein [Dyadobacter pollutisoli]
MRHNLSFLLILLPIFCIGQTGSKNYIINRAYKQTGADPNDVSKVNIQVQYLDGLGRPLQNVTVGKSPIGTDLVQPIEYDAFGRQVKQYLPYAVAGSGAFQPAAPGAQAGFYSANSAGLEPADLARPYSETGFELSPLNRPLTQRSPGNKSTQANISNGANTAGEVKRYDYVPNVNILLTVSSNGDYAAGKLYRIQTTDENGKISTEFTDMQGRLVCRKAVASGNEILATYYVYDDYGQLRSVLQPQYQDNASTADYAFLYEYDNRGRVVVKKIPGADIVNLVYDNFDRQVLSQDAAQLARGVWGFTKYDALNRAILTGEIASASSRATWQASINANQVHHEDKAAGGVGYSLGNTLPNIVEANVLVVNYYDDYSFPKPANLGYANTYGINAINSAKGLQTGSRARMLAGANQWLTSATYYDSEYRPVQTVRELYDLGAGAIERVSMQYKYDLAPVIAQEKTEQIISTGTNVHLKTYEYDHADRLLSVKEKVVNGSKSREAITLAQRYNALGQLQHKWFHSDDGINFRRRTTYIHNIRGWLTQEQTFYKTKENEPDSSFYNFSLSYANGNNYTNGNISQMQWSGKAENTFTKGLAFTYDGANRLLGSTGLNNYAETEGGISYDKNGNIKTLIRSGVVLDNLSYAYVGNRLSAVTDGSGSNTGVKNGASNYGYDGNGNMTSDGNRGAVLTYNYLNLPKTVTIAGKTLTYDYDASGTKHKYVADTLTAKYAGDFEYNQSNVFKRLAISDGQAVYRKDTIRFDYFLKDHLGNVRVVFDERGRILQRTDYYPFGLEIDRDAPLQMPSARNNVNRFLYNGKELQVGTGLVDYGARMYMPEVGRWGVVDPMSENGRRWSPYTYGFDNPMRFIDPDGMWPGQGLWNRFKESIKDRSDWNKIPEHFKDYARKHPINALMAQKIALQGESLEAKLGNGLGMNGETTDRTKSPHDGGVKNAVKHAFSSALVSMRIGKLDGKEITNLNELTQKHDPLLSMDLANNQLGVEIGDGLSFTASNSDVLSKVLEAGLNGELTIVTFDKNNDPTANKVYNTPQ